MSLNPTDTHFVDRFKRLEDTVDSLVTARQPNISDWYILNKAEYSHISDNAMLSTSGQIDKFFQFGTKVRIKQGGVTKYFYTITTTFFVITLNAGDDFLFTNDPIEEIAISGLASPTGFPSVFNYTPSFFQFTIAFGAQNYTPTINDFYYKMIGQQVTIAGDFQGTLAAQQSQIWINFPTVFPTFGNTLEEKRIAFGTFADHNGVYRTNYTVAVKTPNPTDGDIVIDGNVEDVLQPFYQIGGPGVGGLNQDIKFSITFIY